jgi:hypothetical protein
MPHLHAFTSVISSLRCSFVKDRVAHALAECLRIINQIGALVNRYFLIVSVVSLMHMHFRLSAISVTRSLCAFGPVNAMQKKLPRFQIIFTQHRVSMNHCERLKHM